MHRTARAEGAPDLTPTVMRIGSPGFIIRCENAGVPPAPPCHAMAKPALWRRGDSPFLDAQHWQGSGTGKARVRFILRTCITMANMGTPVTAPAAAAWPAGAGRTAAD